MKPGLYIPGKKGRKPSRGEQAKLNFRRELLDGCMTFDFSDEAAKAKVEEGYVAFAAEISDLKMPELMNALEVLGQNHPDVFPVADIASLCDRMTNARYVATDAPDGPDFQLSSIRWAVSAEGRVAQYT